MLLLLSYDIIPAQSLAALLRDIYISFVHLVLFKVTASLNNEAVWKKLSFFRCGLYNKVALLLR